MLEIEGWLWLIPSWTVVFRKEMCFKGWVGILPPNKWDNSLLGGGRSLCKPRQCPTIFLLLRTTSSLMFLECKVWGGRSGSLGWGITLWKNLCSTWVEFYLLRIKWFLKQGNDMTNIELVRSSGSKVDVIC